MSESEGGVRGRGRAGRNGTKTGGMIQIVLKSHPTPNGRYRDKYFLPMMQYYGRFMRLYEGVDCMTEVVPPTLEVHLANGGYEYVLMVHDESICKANDGTRSAWMKDGEERQAPKTLGGGVMVSDFLSERIGKMRFTQEQWNALDDEMCAELLRRYRELNQLDVSWKGNLPKSSVLLMHGTSNGKEGWWRGENVVEHALYAALLFELLHPPNCRGLWVFDNSSNHGLLAPDALYAKAVNANPGGGQAKMRKGWYVKKEREVEDGWIVIEIERQSMQFEEGDVVLHNCKIVGGGKGAKKTEKGGGDASAGIRFKEGTEVKSDGDSKHLLLGVPKGGKQVRLWSGFRCVHERGLRCVHVGERRCGERGDSPHLPYDTNGSSWSAGARSHAPGRTRTGSRWAWRTGHGAASSTSWRTRSTSRRRSRGWRRCCAPGAMSASSFPSSTPS